MKFYPAFTLHKNYMEQLPESKYFSRRIPDYSVKTSLDSINRAENICENNHVFLDFGAGNGRYSAALLCEFEKGYGIEIENDELLTKLAKSNPRYTALFGANVTSKIKENVDLIVLMDVIEHIPLDEIEDFAKKMAKLQKKGGVVYVSTPNAIVCGNVQKSGLYYKRFKYGHHKHYIAKEIVDLFAPYGYKPVILTYEDFPVRLFLKQLNIGCSFLDKKLSSIPLYSLLSYPLVMLVNLVFYLMGPLITRIEYSQRDDSLRGRSFLLTLKKF